MGENISTKTKRRNGCFGYSYAMFKYRMNK